MTAWLNDLRYSANVFRTRPLYAAVIVLVLAVAIGANATVFAVFNGLFLRPLPYPEGDRLVMVYDAYPLIGLDNAGTAIPDYLERRAEARSLKDLAIVRMQARTLTGEGPSERLLVANASASLFDVLRTEPALGRRFTEAETEAGDGRLAVLSHRLWRTRFGAEADIVGRQIRLDDETVRILGVMPEHFGFPSRSIDAWLPFIITPEQRSDAARGVQFSTSVGRLREGATIESLNAELDAIVRRNVAEGRIGADAVDEAGFTGRAAPLRESRVGDLDRMVLVLLASVGAVLLIACANVANLQLARVAGRGRELAIRAVIGAGRMRLVRLVVLESVLLALIGAAVGLLLAHGGLALVRGLGLERDGFELALDGRVVVFTFAAALLAAVVASLPPLLALVGDGAMPILREAGRHGGGGRRTQLLRDGLVVAQISLGVALLVGAGLLLKSFYLLQQEGTGFDANSVWTAQVSLPRSAAAQRADWASFHQRALETLRALPGATAAAYTSVLPCRR